MLSRIAAPKTSGPPNASCASSKTIWILLTVPVTGTKEKFAGQVMVGVGATQNATRGGPQLSLIHPSPRSSASGGGELQPRKKNPCSEPGGTRRSLCPANSLHTLRSRESP